MTYRIAGIDVHKRMLAVVVTDVAVDGVFEFAHRRVGTSPGDLAALAAWLSPEAVEEGRCCTARRGGTREPTNRPLSPTDRVRVRPPQRGHFLEDVARDDRLGFLASSTPRPKTPAGVIERPRVVGRIRRHVAANLTMSPTHTKPCRAISPATTP